MKIKTLYCLQEVNKNLQRNRQINIISVKNVISKISSTYKLVIKKSFIKLHYNFLVVVEIILISTSSDT